MNKVIKIKNEKNITPKELIEACNGDEIIARILFNRGIITREQIKEITDLDNYVPFNSLDFPNIDKAIEIILDSIDNEEKIAVYGDYDVDGVTSTTILVDALKNIGAKVTYHLPDRFSEGYGMNIDVVRHLAEEGVKTIVTCDCGIANFNEIDEARRLGMRVVLTDHHTIGEDIPDADVVINFKLLPEAHKARDISGCATAYHLINAIYTEIGRDDAYKYLDLVALSIIADVITVRNEARYLLIKGMPFLLNGNRIGIKALLDLIGGEIKTEEDIAFQISPRINAAGRMETAAIPVEMLLTKDYDRAYELAQQIDFLNIERKNIQQEIFEEAKRQVEEEKASKNILAIYGEGWHHGIIGIVAGKVCETYGKPSLIMSLSEDGENIVGSARSTEDVNIYEVLKKHEKYLVKFGGHSGAAGFSLNKSQLKEFVKALENHGDIYLASKEENIVYADMELKLNQINYDLVDRIESLSPYGEGFDRPIFCNMQLNVIADRVTPKGHHFPVLEDIEGNKINALLWFGGSDSLEGQKISARYTITESVFNGEKELKLQLNDVIILEDKEIIDYEKPIFSLDENYSINEFIKKFLGIIKFAISNKSGIISMKKLSELVHVEEELVQVIIAYLEEMGYFKATFAGDMEEVFFEISNYKGKRNTYLEKTILKALNEKKEMVEYFKESEKNEEF